MRTGRLWPYLKIGRLWPYLKTGRQKTQSFGCIKARTQIGHRRWCSWFLLCLVALGATAEVAAQRPGDQLEVEVFDPFTPFDQVDLAGFRPITVTVKPIAGTIGQRDVPIWIVQRLRERFSYSSSREVVRYHRFVLPAGASSITAQFVALCRHDSYWNESLHLELDGDLRFRPGDKADFAQAEPFGNRVRTGHLPRILWLTPDRQMLDTDRVRNLLIDFSKRRGDGQFQVDLGRSQPYPQAAELGQLAELESVLVEAYGREFFSENGKKLAPVGGTAPHFDWTFFSACPPSYFPEEWTPLTNVDLVLCQRNELEALNPAQLRTLADWVGLGGRLVVTGCRENSSDQASLPEFLLGAELAAGQQLRQPQWWQAKPLQENGFPQASVENAPEYLGNSSYDYPGIYFSTVRFAPVKLDVAPRSVEEEAVTYFDYLFGRVLCLGPGVTELGAQGWRALLMASYGNGRGEQVATVLGRLNLAGEPVGGFQVAGVGDPPRGLFLALILIFASLVGPFAYTVLYRNRRLSLLLAVVPVISALATLALLGTVILSDGFSFRARRFSYTRLDQNSQRAVTLTNHAVFSGLSPGAYRFGPRELGIVKARNISGTELTELRAEGTRVSAPEVSARTKHQVYSASARTAPEGVRVMRQGNDGQTEWVVRNELGQRIERLLLRTEEGWYQVGELAAGGEARAINTDPLSFANEIAPWLRRAAAPGDRADSNLGIWNRSTNDWSHPFEQWGLIDYLLPKNDLPGSLKPGEYLALLEDDSKAGSLAEKVRYQQQVHVIHGQW